MHAHGHRMRVFSQFNCVAKARAIEREVISQSLYHAMQKHGRVTLLTPRNQTL